MKQLIRRALRAIGIDIVRWNPNKYVHGYNAQHLARHFSPRTVIDVGVAWGTPALYEAFPDARFILVEPLEEYRPAIDAIASRYDCRVYYNAAGSSEGEVVMTVDAVDPEKSSFNQRTALTSRGHETRPRTVKVTTLDRILAENPDIERPIFLKIDTEGYEIEVLRGASRLLEITDWVLSEVSVAARFEGGYRFEDFIEFMRGQGFQVADILAIAHDDDEREPHHMDVLFKREGLTG